GAVQGGRPGAHPQPEPDDPYPIAALCPRQARHGRGGARLPCLSRYGGDRRRRQPAMALRGRLPGARIVGRGGRPRDHCVDRGVRALSGTGVSASGDDGDRAAFDEAAAALPELARDADGPVFREPWEAQAFAMTVALYRRGLFAWTEWAAALAEEIKRAQAQGDPDRD